MGWDLTNLIFRTCHFQLDIQDPVFSLFQVPNFFEFQKNEIKDKRN